MEGRPVDSDSVYFVECVRRQLSVHVYLPQQLAFVRFVESAIKFGVTARHAAEAFKECIESANEFNQRLKDGSRI